MRAWFDWSVPEPWPEVWKIVLGIRHFLLLDGILLLLLLDDHTHIQACSLSYAPSVGIIPSSPSVGLGARGY